jgi:uncharacterized membrane protein YesL
MKEAGQVIGETLVDAYYDFTLLMTLNLLWVVVSLPVLTLPPALLGLQYAAHQMVHERHAVFAWETFFEGFRSCFLLSWRWALLNLLMLATLSANYLFYGQFSADWVPWVQGIFMALATLWTLIQVTTLSLLMEQEDRRVWTALRNSLVLFARKPAFSLVLFLSIGLVAVISTIFMLPWILFTVSLISYLANRCTAYLVHELTDKEEGRSHVT